jgi:type IV pilus assembly protein PilE
MCPDPIGGASRAPARAGQRGMTLIELMIVVVLIAILGSIAVPSYQSYVMKARRADARGALTNAAQMLERFSTENASTGYSTATLSDSASPGPSVVSRITSENGHYTLSFAAGQPTVSTFVLEAARAGGQAGDTCGTFTLNQRGLRGVKAGTTTKTAAECW